MKNGQKNSRVVNALALFTQLGVSMGACILIGVLLGVWMDKLFSTSPVLLLLFSFMGAAASFKVMYDLTMKGHKFPLKSKKGPPM